MRGTLSRWLLPFDQNTRIDEQSSTLHSVLNRDIPESLQGKIPNHKTMSDLVAGLNNVRHLIRVKIADDNDLEQARDALKTIVSFFQELKAAAVASSSQMFDLLECRLNLHSKIGNNKNRK
jgi:hypothetical protein